jgi:tetratricopeptide (TPR) repeat protein
MKKKGCEYRKMGAQKSTPRAKRSATKKAGFGADAETSPSCTICWNGAPPPIQRGCACRGPSGLAHVGCMVKMAASNSFKGPSDSSCLAWLQCKTCGQAFTGKMKLALGEALWQRVKDRSADDPARVSATYLQATCRAAEGRYEEAEVLARDALSKQRRQIGDDAPATLQTATLLATSLAEQGRHEEGAQIEKLSLSVLTSKYGEEHPATVLAMGNLAAIYSMQGNYQEAERLNQRAVEISKRVNGPHDVLTLSFIGNLATTISKQGRTFESERIYRENTQTYARVFGPDHPSTLTSMSNHAEVLDMIGRYQDAESLAQRVYDARKRVHGPNHKLTNGALGDLAFALVRNDKYERALEIYQTIYRNQEAELGDHHPHTKSTADDIRELQRRIAAEGPAKPVNAVLGARVRLRDLSSAEYNGTPATVVSVPEGAQARYRVKLATGPKLGKDILVRRENFLLLCAYTECLTGKEATLVCSRCKTERYCCKHCQREHWTTHKLVCSPRKR